MELSREDNAACALLRISGSVGPFDGARLSGAVAKALADDPELVVCDLSEVDWLDPVCVAVWVAAQWAGPWPGPVLWLAGAHGQPAEALRATGAGRFLSLAASTQDALAQQWREPPLRRDRLTLAPVPTAPARARRFAAEVLTLWAVPDLMDEAVLIVSELVTNGLQHAHSDLELRVELAQHWLQVAVRDGGRPRPPGADAPAGVADGSAHETVLRESGRGLEIVQALAVACGQTSAPAGGRIYWASLSASPR